MSPMPLLPDAPMPEPVVPAKPARSLQEVRVLEPVRNQVEMVCRDLDSTLPEDHPARAIWAFLDRLDLTAFYQQIRMFCDGPGRPTTDPKVLLALWLYATTDGLGNARRLAALCETHDAYRWIRGGVPINYHMLSDFRVGNPHALDTLMTDILAAMMAEHLVVLMPVAQDGMRVRASAGAASFRREERLEKLREDAAAEVAAAVAGRPCGGRDQAGAGRSGAGGAGASRAAHRGPGRTDRPARTKRTEHEQAAVRVSTTDPAARVMKMADGGFRPAYNVQLATDTHSQVVVGVAVSTAGSDAKEAAPIVSQLEARVGAKPEEHLVDGGFTNKETIDALSEAGVTLYGPVQKPKDPARDLHQPLPTDSEAVAVWRSRMGEAASKAIDKQRAATAECVNAKCRSLYGMQQFRVRGINNVTCVVLLTVMAHNLLRWIGLAG